MEDNSFENWSKWIRRVAWVLRKLRLGSVVRQVRNVATLWLLYDFHFRLIHRIRALSARLEANPSAEAAAALANQICTEARLVLGNFLDLKPNNLHCCLKLMASGGPGNEDEARVSTWARSEPFDDRPFEQGDANAHLVRTNSVWSALYGRDDGETRWRIFTCFCCNDLAARAAFRCDRKNWQNFYHSTLAFPLRFPNNADGGDGEYQNLGFLAFDSPRKNVFRGLPDIYNHVGDPTGYRTLLEGSPAFHLGAMIADSIAIAIRPLFNQTPSRANDA